MKENKDIQGKLSLKQDIIVEFEAEDKAYNFHMPVGGSWAHALRATEEINKEVKAQYDSYLERKNKAEKEKAEEPKK